MRVDEKRVLGHWPRLRWVEPLGGSAKRSMLRSDRVGSPMLRAQPQTLGPQSLPILFISARPGSCKQVLGRFQPRSATPQVGAGTCVIAGARRGVLLFTGSLIGVEAPPRPWPPVPLSNSQTQTRRCTLFQWSAECSVCCTVCPSRSQLKRQHRYSRPRSKDQTRDGPLSEAAQRPIRRCCTATRSRCA